MIHGYHVIITAYGFWLPNDPRGSWTDFVAKWELVRFGISTRPNGERRLPDLTPVELRRREAMRAALKYDPVRLTGRQAQVVARGFAKACERSGFEIWACAILPEHTHLVVCRHRYSVERVAIQLKGQASRALTLADLHPLARHAKPGQRPPRMWSEHEWKVYLDSETAIDNAIAYVCENPRKEGKREQRWSFVQPFTGLPTGWITYL